MNHFMQSIRSFTSLTLGAILLATATPIFADQTVAGIISATDQQGPKTAKHLRFGIWNKAGNPTTYTIGNSWNDWMLWLQFDKLVEPSPYVGQAENWLATKVEQISDDARIWEITLRGGVKWHDGSDFTAEDVAFTFNYYREGPSNRWTHHVSYVPRINAEVLDTLKVRVTSEKPMPNFDRITAADIPMIQKSQWDGVEKPRQFKKIGIGTGPYILLDYKADEYYHFKANENYWQGKPLVDELTLIMIKDPQTMFTALRTGELDGAARSLPPELVREWQADPKIEIAKAPSLWGVWVDINSGQKPFHNRDLRHAISLAIDSKPILEQIMMGMGKLGGYGWLHVDSFWTRPSTETVYDVKAAKKILDEQGFVDKDGDGFRELPDGSPLDWNLTVATNRPLQIRAAEMVTKQLEVVGIKAHVRTMEPGSFSGLWNSRDFDMRVADITPHGTADQDMQIVFWRGDRKREVVPDEERAEIVGRWLDAETREKRLAVSFELQEYQSLYPDRVVLWWPDGIFAYNWQSYDNYVSSAGYGIFHKYSFLPSAARVGTTESITSKLDY